MKFSKTTSLKTIGTIFVVAMIVGSAASAKPISQVYMLGDSSSDVGFWGERFTNQGDMWIEALSKKLGFQSTAANLVGIPTSIPTSWSEIPRTKNGGNNYALGGASAYITDGIIPTFSDELAMFRDDHQTIDPHALVLVWMGGNDPFYSVVMGIPFDTQALVNAHDNFFQSLKSMDAKNIVVFNEPSNLTYSDPDYTDEQLAAYRVLIAVSNAALEPAWSRQGLYIIDLNKLTDDVLNNLSKYGFTYGTTGQVCGNAPDSPPCTLPNDGHVFGVTGHYSSAMHQVISDFTLAQLYARDQFTSLLTQPMAAMRREVASLEPRLNSTAFFNTDEQGIMRKRAVGKWQLNFGVQGNHSNDNATGGTLIEAKTNGGGGYIGGDVLLTNRILLGGELSLGTSHGDFNHNSGDFSRNTIVGTGYMTARLTQNAYVQTALTYGAIDYNKIRRSSTLGSTAREIAQGKTTGNYSAARIGTGYDIRFKSFTVTPNAALTYDRVVIDGYKENDNVLALAYGNSHYDALRASIGVNIISTNQSKFYPYARISVEKDLKNNDIKAKIGSNSATIVEYSVERPEQKIGRIALGSQYQISKSLSLDINLSADKPFEKQSDTNLEGYIGMSYNF